MRDSRTPAFLSHSTVDKPAVRLLADELASFGARIWLDELELAAGDLLSDRITRAIESSGYLIACLSPASIQSEWVKREIAIADSLIVRGRAVAIVPVLIDGLADEQLPATLRDRLYADCRSPQSYDSGLRRILCRLQRRDRTQDPLELLAGFEEQPLPFDAARAHRFITAAGHDTLRPWIIEYLALSAARQQDPTARHFLYRALGQIGGPIAMDSVRAGCADPDPWARKGALEAMASVGREPHDAP